MSNATSTNTFPTGAPRMRPTTIYRPDRGATARDRGIALAAMYAALSSAIDAPILTLALPSDAGLDGPRTVRTVRRRDGRTVTVRPYWAEVEIRDGIAGGRIVPLPEIVVQRAGGMVEGERPDAGWYARAGLALAWACREHLARALPSAEARLADMTREARRPGASPAARVVQSTLHRAVNAARAGLCLALDPIEPDLAEAVAETSVAG